MQSTQKHRLRRLLVLLMVLGTVAAACGNSGSDDNNATGGTTTTTAGGSKVALDVPGVTADEIRFASFGTNSNNPLGTCVLDCYDDGIKAYFAWRNSEGGVDGRKLVLSKELDDELSKNQQRAIEIVAANDVFGAFSATQIANGWKDIAKAGIPLYTWSIHPESSGLDSVFGYTGATCYTCTRRATAYIAKLAKATRGRRSGTASARTRSSAPRPTPTRSPSTATRRVVRPTCTSTTTCPSGSRTAWLPRSPP